MVNCYTINVRIKEQRIIKVNKIDENLDAVYIAGYNFI